MSTTTKKRGIQVLKTATVAAAANEILYLNDFVDSGTVSLFPGAGATAKIEFTTSDPDAIASANWIDGPHGATGVTADTSYRLESVITAIRCSSVAGAASTFEISYRQGA